MPYNADTSSHSYISMYLRAYHCVQMAVLFSTVAQFFSPQFAQPDHSLLDLSCSFYHLFWCHFLPCGISAVLTVGYSYSNLQCDLEITSVPSYGREEEAQHKHHPFACCCLCCQLLQGLCSPGKGSRQGRWLKSVSGSSNVVIAVA